MVNRKEVPELGPLEYQLLRLLWRESPASARRIREAYNQKARKPLAYTTIMTLLTRMAEKGVLKVDRSRQPFEFSPLVSRDQVQRNRVKDLVDRFFEGSTIDLALRLVEETDLSEASIRKLERLLKEKGAGTTQKEDS